MRGATFRSQESAFWDKTVLNPRYHRLLSLHANQQLLCDHLASQGLKASLQPRSLNSPTSPDENNWVATTTLLLTITIWEPKGV